MLVRPSIISKVVVLPAPFGPNKPKISFGLISREMPLTAAKVSRGFQGWDSAFLS